MGINLEPCIGGIITLDSHHHSEAVRRQDTIRFRVASLGAGLGASLGLSAALGAWFAHTQSDLPSLISPSLGILIAFLSGFIGASVGGLINARGYSLSNPNRRGLLWLWPIVFFVAGSIFPLLIILVDPRFSFAPPSPSFLSIFMRSITSFGLAGLSVGISGIVLQSFFWRWLIDFRWGKYLAFALSILLGLSAGWAAYGWVSFSSRLIQSIG
jgi:hypothetical protein